MLIDLTAPRPTPTAPHSATLRRRLIIAGRQPHVSLLRCLHDACLSRLVSAQCLHAPLHLERDGSGKRELRSGSYLCSALRWRMGHVRSARWCP
jgi:hypothetical protein